LNGSLWLSRHQVPSKNKSRLMAACLNEIRQPHLWEQRKIPTGDVRGSDHGGQCRLFPKIVNGKSHARSFLRLKQDSGMPLFRPRPATIALYASSPAATHLGE
jgi:hypothetical protein